MQIFIDSQGKSQSIQLLAPTKKGSLVFINTEIKNSAESVHICNRCIMDDAGDPDIVFNDDGICNYCSDALEEMPHSYFPHEIGRQKLEKMLRTIKSERKDEKYDCLMGLSGGLDSSYLAYLGAARWGLRILAVHVDDGFDTKVSSENIRKLCEKAKIELITVKPDKQQYCNLTKAFMKAGVPNIASPQDNILFAELYSAAKHEGIPYFLSGANFSLECIYQRSNTHPAYDLVNLKSINRQFGNSPIDKLPLISFWRKAYIKRVLNIRTVCPLDYIRYERDAALVELNSFCGFEYYGRKHLENDLTAFVQLRWFPEKFGVDKRKWHLSSMIVSGQMTRDQALREYSEPLYDERNMERINDIISKELGITRDALEALLSEPGHQHNEYRTDKIFPIVKRMARI